MDAAGSTKFTNLYLWPTARWLHVGGSFQLRIKVGVALSFGNILKDYFLAISERRAVSITWRAVTEADLPECLALEPRHLGDEIVGANTARAIWRDLARDLSFNSGVFVETGLGKLERILAFGACVFIKSGFADQELADPRPCMNSRIFASIAAGRSVLLNASELYSPSSEGGLDVALLFGNYRSSMHQEQEREVQRLLPFGLARCCAAIVCIVF